MTETVPNPQETLIETLRPYPWWVILIQGVVALLLGLFFLFTPIATLFALVTFVGIYWFISGIFSLISLSVDRSNMGWRIFAGILGIIAGILIIAYPLMATLLLPALLVTIIAFLGIILGFVYLFQAFSAKDWGTGVMGLLALIIGVLILAKPIVAFALLPFVLGVLGIICGVACIIFAYKVKTAESSPA